MKKSQKGKKFVGPQFFGAALLGERGQVVIPSEIRKRLNLKKGDTFMVMLNNHAIVLLPKKMMQQFVKMMSDKLDL